MSPRVARIITRLNVGGPAYQAALLTHLLPKRGYKTLLITGQCEPHEPEFLSLLDEYPCDVVYCRHLRRQISPLADALALCEIAGVLREFKPDIVHTHTAKAGALGRLAGKLTGAKRLVHTFHGHVLEGYFSSPAQRAVITAERTLARMTDALVTVSDCLRVDLVERFKIAPSEKCQTIELGLPLARFLRLPERGHWRARFNIPATAVVMGWLGRLVKIKNPSRLVDIFTAVVKALPDRQLHLIIGGAGPLEKAVGEQISRTGLNTLVHPAGLISDLPQFYADLDLMILTSDNEGTPAALIEAQAAGVFSIAPAVGGIPDIIRPKYGTVVAPNTVESYVEILTRLLARPPRPIVGIDDRQATVKRFAPERLVDEIDKLYGKLLPSIH
jgi:glycosyltransferase involved in cell wall biosynthesis